MYAKIALGDDRGEGQHADRLEASFVHALRVLVLVLEPHLEREAFGQATTCMMAAEEEGSLDTRF